MTTNIPQDIWGVVLSFLPYLDLVHASLCNKCMRDIALPLQQQASDSLILSTLHFKTHLGISLLEDPSIHVIFWRMVNESKIVVAEYKMKNLREALNTICFDVRLQLYSDGLWNMISEWSNSRMQTKKLRLCCSASNCTEQPLPTGRCEKHTKELLNNSDVYVIKFFEEYTPEYCSGTTTDVMIAQKSDWEQVLVEKILGTETERAGNEYTDIDWNPNFKVSEFLYGYHAQSCCELPAESFALFFGRLENTFDQSKEYEKENVLL